MYVNGDMGHSQNKPDARYAMAEEHMETGSNKLEGQDVNLEENKPGDARNQARIAPERQWGPRPKGNREGRISRE